MFLNYNRWNLYAVLNVMDKVRQTKCSKLKTPYSIQSQLATHITSVRIGHM